LTSEQAALESVFFLATSDAKLEYLAGTLWIALAFSWIPGLVSVRLAWLRPVYWLLIVAIPVAYSVQLHLIHKQALHCDGP
jgi:hypothetical protein